MKKKWHHHFSVIMSMKEHIDKNYQEVYKFIYDLIKEYVNNDKITYHDFTLCLIYVCRVEYVNLLFKYVNDEVFTKNYYKNLEKQRTNMLKLIDQLESEINNYDKPILDNPKISRVEQKTLYYLEHYKKKLLQDQSNKKQDYLSTKEYNYVYSQKILSKTGARDLLARMLCVAIQILFYHEYQQKRFKMLDMIDKIIIYFFDKDDIVCDGRNPIRNIS